MHPPSPGILSTRNRNGAELAALPERPALGTCRRGVGPELAALPERQRKMPTGSRTGRTLEHKLWVVDKRPKIVQGHAGLGRSCPSALMGFKTRAWARRYWRWTSMDMRSWDVADSRQEIPVFGSQDGRGKQTHSCWRRGNEANSCQAGGSTFSCTKTPRKKTRLRVLSPIQHLQPPCKLAVDRRPHRRSRRQLSYRPHDCTEVSLPGRSAQFQPLKPPRLSSHG